MTLKLPLFLFATALVALPAAADVYKCQRPDGSVVISNSRCSTSASVVKSISEDSISAEQRAKAEREVARQAEYAHTLEKQRLAREATEKKKSNKENKPRAVQEITPIQEIAPIVAAPKPPPEKQAPSPEAIQICLDMLNKMVLDPARRQQMENNCRNGTQEEEEDAPRFDPNYVGGPAYIQPPYIQPRPPKPEHRPHPEQLPETAAPKKPARPGDIPKVYQSPNQFNAR